MKLGGGTRGVIFTLQASMGLGQTRVCQAEMIRVSSYMTI
jgi:hypothetical protein